MEEEEEEEEIQRRSSACSQYPPCHIGLECAKNSR